jgi:hypothetical protein
LILKKIKKISSWKHGVLMNKKNPLERAREYIGLFKRSTSEECREDGEKIIRLFPEARVLFMITLSSDFLEKYRINSVKKHCGYRFRLKILDYHISKERKLLDNDYYNDLIRISPNPPRSMNEGNKIISGINQKGIKIVCDDCDGRGDVPCSKCDGMGKWTCPSCRGDGKNTCSSCFGKGEIACPSCGGSGERACPSCGGSRDRTCTYCGGGGERACPFCEGLGYYEDNRNGQYYHCPHCRGGGVIVCIFCGGTGGIECSYCGCSGVVECSLCRGLKIVDCTRCRGIGTVICDPCKGTAEQICYVCNGKGKIVCSTCKGYGSMMDADVWKMETRIINEDYPLKLEIPNYIVNKLKGNRPYGQIFINDDLPWILNNTQISRCELEGTGFELWEINYSYNGDKYNLYKETGGDFYWDSYPKDWKKIGIFSVICFVVISVIVIFVTL